MNADFKSKKEKNMILAISPPFYKMFDDLML